MCGGSLDVKDSSGAAVLDILYKRKILRLKPQYDDTFSVILSVAKNLCLVQHDRQNTVILNLFQDLTVKVCKRFVHIYLFRTHYSFFSFR